MVAIKLIAIIFGGIDRLLQFGQLLLQIIDHSVYF